MKRALLLFFLLTLPPSTAQAPPRVEDLRANAGNQRVDLEWGPVAAAAEYVVRVYQDGELTHERNATTTSTSFLLTNGRTYAFTVAARNASGIEGPPSNPVAATPRLDRDLAYLATGVIAVWLGLFGYAAALNRKEARLNRQLEQLLQHSEPRNR